MAQSLVVGQAGVLAKDIPGKDCICRYGVRAGTWIRIWKQHSPKKVIVLIPNQQANKQSRMLFNDGMSGEHGNLHKIRASRIQWLHSGDCSPTANDHHTLSTSQENI